MVDIDSETLFNGAAAAVATVAVFVFVLNVEFPYSPVSKIALVLLFLSGVFAITQRTDDYQLTLLGYGVIVVSVVALFFETVSTFELGDAVTVLGLLVIAALLFAVRSLLGEENRFVSGRQATYAFGLLAVVIACVLAVDVVTGGLAYELQTKDTVEITGEGREAVRLGTLTATNPTPLPERVEIPNYQACTAGNWSAYRSRTEKGEPRHEVSSYLQVRSGYGDHVLSYGSRTYPVTLELEAPDIEGATFPVTQTDSCPETETGDPYIAVFEAPEEYRHGRPV